MPQFSHHCGWFACLFLAGFAIRLAGGFWWQSRLPEADRFVFADSESYWELGQAMARGQPYAFGDQRVFRTPGYPLLLAGLFRVVGNDPPVMVARALGAVFGMLAAGAVAWLAWLLFDQRTSLLATALATVYPGAIAMSIFVLSEGPFCPIMLVHLICWSRAWNASLTKPRLAWALSGGWAAGAATLVRPSWLLFTPFALALGLIIYRGRSRQAFIGLIMLIGLAMVMTPWWIRNWLVTGRFVPTTLQVGASLYDGLNPHATGASDMKFVSQFVQQQQAADRASATPPVGLFEDRLDRRLRDAAVDWAAHNPMRALELVGIKLARMWNIWPNSSDLRSWPLRVIVMLGYTPLLVCGVWGAVKFAGRGWPYGLCSLPAIYFTCLHVVFVSSIRYRQPAMLPLIVLAAGLITQLVWKKRPGQSPGATTDFEIQT
jgi:4-amino-4-deoxy-L-arabinose transferase-like glycosyltransferase